MGSCTNVDPPELVIADNTSHRLYWADVEVLPFQGSDASEKMGQQLYQARCVSCHGRKGLGDGVAAAFMTTRPRDFSTGEYKLLSTTDFPSDEDLYRTVTVGIPAFGMPSFEYLSSEERWAVVYYIKRLGQSGYAARLEADAVEEKLELSISELSDQDQIVHTAVLDKIRSESKEYAATQFQPEGSLPLPPFPANTSGDLEFGKVLYTDLGCVSCHGINGDGDGNSTAAMTDNQGRVTHPRDFREGGWYFKSGDRREDIVRVVMGGMPGTPMPSLDLGDDENGKLWDVAAYVEYLATRKTEN